MNHPFVFLLLGLLITAFLFWFVRILFVYRIRLGFRNFFIGDTGVYSIARVQAVAWAYFIMSMQISIIMSLLFNPAGNCIGEFKLEFSESVLWLLGLSLASYISVKGITVNQINHGERYTRKDPKLSDLVQSGNGLDFSKFQMLIWTILSLLLFEYDVYEYINEISHAAGCNNADPSVQGTEIETLFISDQTINKFLPQVDWSLIVLMGLSQGAYLGKKLVPSFKVDELKQDRHKALILEQEQLTNQITQKQKLKDLISKDLTPTTNEQLIILNDQIAALNAKLSAINSEMNSITNNTNPL